MTRNIGLTERTSLIVSQLKDGQPSAWPAVDSVARTPHQSRGVASRCGAKTPQYTHYGRWQIATTVRIYRQRAVRSWATGHQPLRSTGFGGTTVPTKNKTWSTRREVVIVMGQRDSRLISPQSCPTDGVHLTVLALIAAISRSEEDVPELIVAVCREEIESFESSLSDD